MMVAASLAAIRQKANHGASIDVQSTSLDAFIFVDMDVTDSEQYSYKSSVSRSPVPRGNVVDHISDDGFSLNLSGVLVDTPMNQLEWASGRASGIIDQLNTFRKNGDLLIVTTGLESHTDLLLTQIDYERSGPTGTHVRVSLSFESIKTYTPTVTSIDAGLLESPRRAAADAGTDASELAAAEQAAEYTKIGPERSYAARMQDWYSETRSGIGDMLGSLMSF